MMPNNSKAGLLVSVATYNEVGNLRPLVEAVRRHAPDCEILIIDDNSPDGTGRVADELRAEMPGIHVDHRPGKLGLGTALVAAMRFAVEGGYEYLINLDADFSAPPPFIVDLLSGMDSHDVMIGSRYVEGAELGEEFDLKRKLMSAGINWYTWLLLGLRCRDCSNSFRCYRVEMLARIDFDRIRSRGYSIQEEILYLCRQVGCRIGETPIRHEDRRSGDSKLNRSEAARALKIIFLLGIDRLLGRTRSLEVPDRRPIGLSPASR
ncbi:polyprenol monophosphomannose synthase [Tundrisphaera lichenicola]|uniref:polyprenol monophosphomannose synthase n=1 Tax=Tundrisphaera lichenicola TaxID=2029860 RepID=UPI003EBF7541